MASTLNRCLAASHQCSGVGKSFFFVSQSNQKLFMLVLKTLSSNRLLLKCQNPSPRGCLLKSKIDGSVLYKKSTDFPELRVTGREPVFSLWYGRRQGNHHENLLSYKGN